MGRSNCRSARLASKASRARDRPRPFEENGVHQRSESAARTRHASANLGEDVAPIGPGAEIVIRDQGMEVVHDVRDRVLGVGGADDSNSRRTTRARARRTSRNPSMNDVPAGVDGARPLMARTWAENADAEVAASRLVPHCPPLERGLRPCIWDQRKHDPIGALAIGVLCPWRTSCRISGVHAAVGSSHQTSGLNRVACQRLA